MIANLLVRNELQRICVSTIASIFSMQTESARVMSDFTVVRESTRTVYTSDECQLLIASLVSPPRCRQR